MAIHTPSDFQSNLFKVAGLIDTSFGVFESPERILQGVKGQTIDILTQSGGIGFYFQDGYISRIEEGKGEVIISFKIHEKIYKFKAHFSVGISKKRRTIEFINPFHTIDKNHPPFHITDEFEKKDFPAEYFGSNLDSIRSQIQIYILETIWKKEENSKLAHL